MAGLPRGLPAAEGYDIGGCVLLSCSFDTNTTPDSTTYKGDILSSVSYTATGKYTVTFRDLGYDVLFVGAHLQHVDGSVDCWAQAGPVTNTATTKTCEIRTFDSTALTAITQNASTRINLFLVCTRTSVKRRR